MRQAVVNGVRQSLDSMRAARDELAKGQGYVGTAEAVQLCPFPISEETLLSYPYYVIPRFVKNPLAKRLTYLWDPRDIRDLPSVLRRWQVAVEQGSDAVRAFEGQRLADLEERDLKTMVREVAA